MKSPKSPFRQLGRAFTLVEVMVTLGIFSMVGAGLMGFYLYSLNTFAYDVGATMVNSDMRRLLSRMGDSVNFSSHLRVYSEYEDRTTHVDGSGNTTGNLLLCVFEKANADGSNNIVQIVGYYRDAEAGIRRFEVNTDVSASTDLLSLLPSTGLKGSSLHHLEMPECEGLHSGGKVFRDFKNNGVGVMVSAQLLNKGSLRSKASGALHFTMVRRS